MAEAVQNEIPPYARCYLRTRFQLIELCSPALATLINGDGEITATLTLEDRKNIFVGETAGCAKKTMRRWLLDLLSPFRRPI
jgi:hypothetical protein